MPILRLLLSHGGSTYLMSTDDSVVKRLFILLEEATTMRWLAVYLMQVPRQVLQICLYHSLPYKQEVVK